MGGVSKYDPALREKVRTDYAAGKMAKWIAAETGVPQATVRMWCEDIAPPRDYRKTRKGSKFIARSSGW